MKKIFEIFKKKRTYFKAISMILVLALMGQTVSLAVTAISESGLSIDEMISVDEAVPVDNSLETKPSIVGEVESSRDQYTKVYELSDGTFYEVISNDPIHESINGKWEEPINNLVEPTSVDEVTSYCDELVDSIAEEQNGGASTFSYIEKETGNHILQESYVINKQTFKPVASKTVSSYNRLLVKIPENFLSYSNTNQITIKQELSVVCNNPSGNPTGTLYAYGILENWGINKIDDVEYLTVLKSDGTHQKINPDNIKRQKNILDCVVVGVMDITCHFDITEICNKWNKHVLDNNGIYLRTSDNSTTATIEKCYVTRRFMVVDAYDRDFTYHSIDMGKAGQVLINDFTNTLTLQRNEMYYPTGKMPINLYRYFDFSQIYTLSNPAGEGSNWNYECPLVNKDSFKTAWKTFDGHTLYFIRTQTSQDQWIDDQGEGYKLITEDVDILNGDYYNAKIESPDGLIYTFGARGKIRRIDDSEGNYIIVKYNETTQPESAAPQVISHIPGKYFFFIDLC